MATARTKASRKYNEKAYDRIELKVDKGKKTIIREHANSLGESINGFVNRAIKETMINDNKKKA